MDKMPPARTGCNYLRRGFHSFHRHHRHNYPSYRFRFEVVFCSLQTSCLLTLYRHQRRCPETGIWKGLPLRPSLDFGMKSDLRQNIVVSTSTSWCPPSSDLWMMIPTWRSCPCHPQERCDRANCPLVLLNITYRQIIYWVSWFINKNEAPYWLLIHLQIKNASGEYKDFDITTLHSSCRAYLEVTLSHNHLPLSNAA